MSCKHQQPARVAAHAHSCCLQIVRFDWYHITIGSAIPAVQLHDEIREVADWYQRNAALVVVNVIVPVL